MWKAGARECPGSEQEGEGILLLRQFLVVGHMAGIKIVAILQGLREEGTWSTPIKTEQERENPRAHRREPTHLFNILIHSFTQKSLFH